MTRSHIQGTSDVTSFGVNIINSQENRDLAAGISKTIRIETYAMDFNMGNICIFPFSFTATDAMEKMVNPSAIP